MMFLFLLILVTAYAVAASWAARHGRDRLWLTAATALLAIALGGALLGRHYAVPSLSRLLVYAVALTGPVVLVPTTMLSFGLATTSTPTKAFPTAILGACFGLACGFVIVVYGLGVW